MKANFGEVIAVTLFLFCIQSGCDSAPPHDFPDSRRIAAELPGLSSPDELVLYSIDGTALPGEAAKAVEEQFHGFPVLGKLTVTDASARKAICEAVKDGVAQSDGMVAACFWPRHGMHVVSNGTSADYVICFQCSQMYVYQNEKASSVATTDSPHALLDDYLRSAGIPLAPSP